MPGAKLGAWLGEGGDGCELGTVLGIPDGTRLGREVFGVTEGATLGEELGSFDGSELLGSTLDCFDGMVLGVSLG